MLRNANFWLAISLAVAVAPLMSGCQTSGEPQNLEAVKRTWEYGMHRVPRASLKPGQFYSLSEIREDPQNWGTRVSQMKLKVGTKVPAVIYLHGCAGNTAGAAWSNKFDELGYAFFAPDSLARPRRSLCYQGQMKSRRIPWRTEELRYALQQLKQLGWINQDRIVLMGSSEGAQAASVYAGDGFQAIILSATDCRFSGGSPKALDSVPVLNMVGANDNKGGGSGCVIRRTVGGSKRVVIQGAGHKLPGYPQAREALEQFLRECCGYAPVNATVSLEPEKADGSSTAKTGHLATEEAQAIESSSRNKGRSDTIDNITTFKVPAMDELWVDSGVRVRKGQIYRIAASGSWTVNSGRCGWSGPDGGSGPCSAPLSFPQAVPGSYSALIAKIGDGPAFLVGRGIDLTANRTGLLLFRINDSPGGFHNNEGMAAVHVTLISSP